MRLGALARVTARRFVRGRTLWICIAIALLPIAFAAALRGNRQFAKYAFQIEELMLVLLPSIVVASAVSGDLEDRAATYLWSRPLARWHLVVGKLLVLAPFVLALVVAGWLGAYAVGARQLATGAQVGALALGALAACALAAGIAVLSPRYGMVVAIVYLLCDGVVGQIPAHVQLVSIAHDVAQLAGMAGPGGGDLAAAIGLAAVPITWLAVGLSKIRRLET